MNSIFENLYYKDNVEIIIMADGYNEQVEKVLLKYHQNGVVKIIRNKTSKGLNAFKKLFKVPKGDYIIAIDDDVLELPVYFDRTLIEYMNLYYDYGFLALNVVQNEFTNGSKPDDQHYIEDIRNEKIVQRGPTGWCVCFRRNDYKKIRMLFNFNSLSMRKDQVQVLSSLIEKYLKLRRGVIKKEVCFHASGPHYAKQYGYLESEIEKYESNKLPSFVKYYKSFLDK